jgi:hypothetical protein
MLPFFFDELLDFTFLLFVSARLLDGVSSCCAALELRVDRLLSAMLNECKSRSLMES